MVRPVTIIGICLALIVVGLVAYSFTSDSLVIRSTEADYEAKFPVKYTDGTTTTINKYATAYIQHDDKVVESIGFGLDVKFKVSQDDVRVISDGSDPDHETKVTFNIILPNFGEYQVSEYPLSTFTNADFSVLDTGDWYHLFVSDNVKVTPAELSTATEGSIGMNFVLQTVVDVWYNIDPTKNEFVHHRLKFTIPFRVIRIVSDADLPDDQSDSDTGAVQYNPGGDAIVATQPDIRLHYFGTTNVRTVPWQGGVDITSDYDWTDYNNLGTR